MLPRFDAQSNHCTLAHNSNTNQLPCRTQRQLENNKRARLSWAFLEGWDTTQHTTENLSQNHLVKFSSRLMAYQRLQKQETNDQKRKPKRHHYKFKTDENDRSLLVASEKQVFKRSKLQLDEEQHPHPTTLLPQSLEDNTAACIPLQTSKFPVLNIPTQEHTDQFPHQTFTRKRAPRRINSIFYLEPDTSSHFSCFNKDSKIASIEGIGLIKSTLKPFRSTKTGRSHTNSMCTDVLRPRLKDLVLEQPDKTELCNRNVHTTLSTVKNKVKKGMRSTKLKGAQKSNSLSNFISIDNQDSSEFDNRFGDTRLFLR